MSAAAGDALAAGEAEDKGEAEVLSPCCLQVWERSRNLKELAQMLWVITEELGQVGHRGDAADVGQEAALGVTTTPRGHGCFRKGRNVSRYPWLVFLNIPTAFPNAELGICGQVNRALCTSAME